MRGPYPFSKQPNYPHLSKYEAALWERFIEQYPLEFKWCWYDVNVGDRRPASEELNPEWRANADYLGTYKIDVVAESDTHLCVIELKKEATTKACGEIWLYDDLYRTQFKPEKPVLNYVITDVEMPNIRALLEKEGVSLFVVGVPTIATGDSSSTGPQVLQETVPSSPAQDSTGTLETPGSLQTLMRK